VMTDINYETWSALFDQTWFRIFTLLALPLLWVRRKRS